MAISKMYIVVEWFLPKAGQDNTNIMTSKIALAHLYGMIEEKVIGDAEQKVIGEEFQSRHKEERRIKIKGHESL